MTARSTAALAALVLLTGCQQEAASSGGALDGAWNLDPDACGRPASDTGLIVAGRMVGLSGMTCRLTSPAQGPDAISAVLDCRGDGPPVRRAVVLRRMGDLLELAEQGTVLRYHRCDGR